MTTYPDRIQAALAVALRFGGIDGARHKAWTIDQIVRALLDCPHDGSWIFGENEDYKEWVKEACNGEDGPETYDWDVGIPP